MFDLKIFKYYPDTKNNMNENARAVERSLESILISDKKLTGIIVTDGNNSVKIFTANPEQFLTILQNLKNSREKLKSKRIQII
jgi:hypothetical protein